MKKFSLVLLFLSCMSNEYAGGALGMKWKPPPGVKLESEATDGNVTTATFSGGVEVRSVTGSVPAPNGDLDQLKAALLTGSKMAAPGEVRMGRQGTIPNGPVVRWEMTNGAQKSLLYYVPGKDRWVLIALTARAGDFDRRSDKLELSMASLHVD
jgi:hypothetical protein